MMLPGRPHPARKTPVFSLNSAGFVGYGVNPGVMAQDGNCAPQTDLIQGHHPDWGRTRLSRHLPAVGGATPRAASRIWRPARCC